MRNKKVAILHYLPLLWGREEVIKRGCTLELPIICVTVNISSAKVYYLGKYHPSISSHIMHY